MPSNYRLFDCQGSVNREEPKTLTYVVRVVSFLPGTKFCGYFPNSSGFDQVSKRGETIYRLTTDPVKSLDFSNIQVQKTTQGEGVIAPIAPFL